MVNIAIPGGSSQVAQEILSALLTNPSHTILLLSRRDAPTPFPYPPSVSWHKTDYSSASLATTLSPSPHPHRPCPSPTPVMTLACIEAGVKRFAPAEWSVPKTPDALDDGKGPIRAFLEEVNTPVKKLEYCLFQPGLFMNYLAAPQPTGARIRQLQAWFDIANRRAIVIEGEEDTAEISWTTVQGLAAMVKRAVEYEGEWPVVGGMVGGTLSAGELIALGEKIRGGRFEVARLKRGDVEREEIQSEWVPVLEHPSIPEEMREVFSRAYVQHSLLEGMYAGFTVGDGWNRIFPDYRFTSPEEFLREVWEGKA